MVSYYKKANFHSIKKLSNDIGDPQCIKMTNKNKTLVLLVQKKLGFSLVMLDILIIPILELNIVHQFKKHFTCNQTGYWRFTKFIHLKIV